MATQKRPTRVELGRTLTIDAAMAPASVAEQVTVRAEAAPMVTNSTIGANYNKALVDRAAAGPHAVRHRGARARPDRQRPNAGQVTIAGAFAYDNVFLINGVDVNDNIFGTSNNLFIEDAIEETQVLTSGISAEYGRFSGGVVNIVTKRGGDLLLRQLPPQPEQRGVDRRDAVRDAQQRPDRFSNVYEGTFGGPILRAKAWFFSAGRFENSTDAKTFPQTGIGLRPGRRQQARRAEGHRHAAGEQHDHRRLHRQQHDAEQPSRPRRLDRAADARDAPAAEHAVRRRTGTASSGRSCSRPRSSRRRSSGSATPAARARTSSTRRS